MWEEVAVQHARAVATQLDRARQQQEAAAAAAAAMEQRVKAALAAADWTSAREHFQRELRSQPDSHEAWFGLARVHAAQGDNTLAEQALRRALAASATAGEQARYAGKLDRLKAALAH